MNTKNSLLEDLQIALRANGSEKWDKRNCRCDAEVNQTCEYCFIDYVLRRCIKEFQHRSSSAPLPRRSGFCGVHKRAGHFECSACYPDPHKLMAEHAKVFNALYRQLLELSGLSDPPNGRIGTNKIVEELRRKLSRPPFPRVPTAELVGEYPYWWRIISGDRTPVDVWIGENDGDLYWSWQGHTTEILDEEEDPEDAKLWHGPCLMEGGGK